MSEKLVKSEQVIDDTMRDIWEIANLSEKFLAVTFLMIMILRPEFKEAYFQMAREYKV